ncbi:glucosaminidase domain-containing protein [Treponema sp.]|uniref:glucosaminidase domain-containing protein n=1 Tax=Treponema sp. TaxID=166 RepID=UPI00298D7800|nr:glucosaminidase domain-containing protein [Treponema sp.]MCQ2240659.1 glucosaminidase domain-containing protein [Treponema sp.]
MKKIFIAAISFALILFAGCVSTGRQKHVSRNLTDRGVMSTAELTAFFMMNNPDADRENVELLAGLYIEEAGTEGINSDCAFIQMCHETGFLTYGNLVTPDMHNYCGLGAINEEQRGLVFETEQLGVRAHIQHLHAYATTADVVLINDCIDPRYRYVNPRGKSPTIEGLAGTWAADRKYSEKLEQLIVRLESM